MKINGKNVFDITLADGDLGVMATSLVAKPAIQSPFLAFNEDEPQFKFYLDPELPDLQGVVGAIMIPNLPIYRKMEDYGQEFFVNFTPEVIKQLVGKMLTNGMGGMFTVQHDQSTKGNEDIELLEMWIKEGDVDKSVAMGFEEPVGTAFMRAKINNDNLWKDIKEHGLNGFSIELDSSLSQKFAAVEEEIAEAEKAAKELEDKKNDNPNPTNMFDTMFKASKEVNGTKVYYNGELKVGTALFVEHEGVPTTYNGEFTADDCKYVVEQGLVKEVENIQISTDEKISTLREGFNEVKTLVTDFFTKNEELTTKEADLELRETQLAEKAAMFSDQKKPKTNNFKSDVLETATTSKEWFSKFVD